MINEKNGKFLNLLEGVLGRTVSTESCPNTTSEFYFWISKQAKNVELANLVAAVAPDGIVTFGTIIAMNAILDMDSFHTDYISHDFGSPEVQPPTEINEIIICKVQIIISTSEKVRPVERSDVYFASRPGIEYALGMDQYMGADKGIPIGVFENGDGEMTPLQIDESFLLGPEGAHLNISGISGLATKTSMVEFAIKSIFEYCSDQRGRKISIVVFNVKGKDLLYFDKPNPFLWEDTPLAIKSRQMYDLLGIDPEPFHDVRIFAPYDRRNPARVKSIRKDGKVEPFVWDIGEIQDDIDQLFDTSSWDDSIEAVWVDIQAVLEKQDIRDYDSLMSWLAEERRATYDPRHTNWHGHQKHIFYKCVKNLASLKGFYDGLVAVDGTKPIDLPINEIKNGSIFVIDLQHMNERGQRMVFNKTLKKLQRLLEEKRTGSDFDNIIVFVDELNKFAPRAREGGKEHMRADLIDIAARGRSLGLTLFGVEQFASEVDKQIVDNSATIMYGRTGYAELKDEIYGWLSPELKARLGTMPRGTILMKHAKFTQALFFKFPLPACIPGDLYIPSADEDITRFAEEEDLSAQTAFSQSEGREFDF
ncbi:MAG: hypothetical protein NTY09_05765 [bacterium]|nr:hypothetical protein [bacterium]